ncbi:efflux RND transporter periplasmic adaptor subunit [Thermophilibacter sp.]
MTREDLERVPTPADEGPSAAGEKGRGASRPERAPEPGDDGPDPNDDPDDDLDDVEERLALESLERHRRARRRKRVIGAGVAAGVVVAALAAWGVAGALSAAPAGDDAFQTTPVARGEFVESVQATGTAQPLTSVVVTPEVDGIIASVDVSLDDVVSKGQTLLTIRNDDLDREVRQAELDLRQRRAETDQAQRAYNDVYYAEGRDAAASLLVPLESARLQQEIAQDAYDQAVARAAGRTVTAPASGSVVVLNAVTGAAVGAGAGTGTGGSGSASGTAGPLVQIADLSQMRVSVQVNEVDISRVAVGQAARVSFSALPGVLLDGTVTRISTVASADEYGYSYGVVTYDVEVLVPEPVPELKPGMTASVEILLQDVPDALTVPTSALMTDDGASTFVYVVTDPETQAVERRAVTVGAQSASEAVVEGGVAEGDLVVADAYSVDPSTVGAGAAAGDAGTADPDAVSADDAPAGDASTTDAPAA